MKEPKKAADVSLGAMPQDELLKLRAKIEFLLAGDVEYKKTSEDILGLSEAEEMLRLYFLRRPMDASTDSQPFYFRNQTWWDAFVRNHKFLLDCADSFRPKTQIERRVAGAIALRSLERWLVAKRIPATLRTIAAQIPNTSVAIEDEFPGYAAQGLLNMLLHRPNGECA